MNEKNIRTYAELMRELGLTGLEITEGDKVVRLERMSSAAPAAVTVPVSVSAAQDAPKEMTVSGNCVNSPMVGVFYAAPSEKAEPFV